MEDWQWIIIKYAEARWHKSRRIRSSLKTVSLIIPAWNSHFPNHRRQLKFSVVSTIKYFNNQWNITIQSCRRESVIINFLIKGRQIYRYMWHAGEMRSMWHVWEWKELLAKFWWGYLRERDQLEDVRIDRRKILKSIKTWTGLIWLRIGISGRVLWTRQWTFRLHKMRRISWLGEERLAFQEKIVLH